MGSAQTRETLVVSRPRRVVAYADASFCRRTKACGWAVSITGLTPMVSGPPQEDLYSGFQEGVSDNNAAEVLALARAVQLALKAGTLEGTQVLLYSDSETAVTDFNPEPLYAAGAASVELRHQYGHKGARNAGTSAMETVDRLAKGEMRKLRDMLLSTDHTEQLSKSAAHPTYRREA